MKPLQKALRRASRQHGALTTADTARAGLTQDLVDGLVARGEWLRPYQGVYTVAGAPADWRQRAMSRRRTKGSSANRLVGGIRAGCRAAKPLDRGLRVADPPHTQQLLAGPSGDR